MTLRFVQVRYHYYYYYYYLDLCFSIFVLITYDPNFIFREFFLFSDDLKIFRVIKSAENCKLLQFDIDSVQKWCINNYMIINIFKTNIYFTGKINSMHFNYFFGDLLVVRTDCVRKILVLCWIANCISIVMLTTYIFRH
jgi:hypothetical protein